MDMDDEDPGDLECEVCGKRDFYLEGGFYYCSECSTQSQGLKHFVEEEQTFIAGGYSQSRVGVLREQKKPKEKATSQSRIKLSSWEVYNFVLKALTNKLVKLGYPALLKDAVFQLWSTYLTKRKVILVSEKHARPSTVTQGEPMTDEDVKLLNDLMAYRNIYSLYDGQPRPRKKTGTYQKRKAQERRDKADNDMYASSTTVKQRRTRAKKQAFEQSYLDTVSTTNQVNDTSKNEFDQYLDDLLASVSSQSNKPSKDTSTAASSGSTKPLPSKSVGNQERATGKRRVSQSSSSAHPPFNLAYSDGIQRVRKAMVERGELPAKRLLVDFRLKVKPTRSKPFLSNRATKELQPEKFSMRSVLILLFVALRQIGSRVLISDILRLYHEGTLCIDNIGSLLSDADIQRVDRSCNLFLTRSIRYTHYLLPDVVRSIQSFLTYMGIEDHEFPCPSYTEFVPKFIEDLKLPCEFEYLIKLHNRTLSIQEIVQDLTFPTYLPLVLKFAPELFIVSMFIFKLKMLFGLDDLTERYQSAFAKKVNEIIDVVMRANENNTKFEGVDSSWGRLFVLQEWFSHHRYRDNVILHAKSSLATQPYDVQPNAASTHSLIEKFDSVCPRTSTSMIDASDNVKTIFQNVSAQLAQISNNNDELNLNQIPNESPIYETLKLPKEDVITEYVRNFPNVSHKNFNVEAVKKDFSKRRIDFILEPEKYFGILKKAGYKVKVLPGDATQYKEEQLRLQNGTLLLFQPFKMYDNYVGKSNSVNFLINLCSSSAFVGSSTAHINGLIHDVVEGIGNLYCKRCRAGYMPLTYNN